MLKIIHILTFGVKKVIIKILELKLVIHVIISKYENIFTKGYTPDWSEEVFVINKIKNTVPWIYIINDVNDEEIVRTSY